MALNRAKAVTTGKTKASTNYTFTVDEAAFNKWAETADKGITNQEDQILAYVEEHGYTMKLQDLVGIPLYRENGEKCSQDMAKVLQHYKKKWVTAGFLKIHGKANSQTPQPPTKGK